ncbi:dipeptidase [Rapidithrix thailandica]|uniref:Dipeptidase n=1 Tax=Rapidithrix thailandica TaxID=413964 RepID=A0AAW9SGJ1_9BACT
MKRFFQHLLMRYLLIALPLVGFWACEGKEQKQKLTEEELKVKANELAHKFIITDGHVDLPYRLRVHMFRLQKVYVDVSQSTEDGDFDYNRAKEGGLDAPFMSIYVPSSYQESGGAKLVADSLIDIVTGIAEKHPEKFAVATTPAEVQQNFEKGLISLPMGMENGAPIEDDLANVKYFYDKGVRYITLTHATNNQICDSSYDTTRLWNGLSSFGEMVVEEMNKVGIMVDISHVSDSTFWDVMKLTKAPVIASHSSCRYYTPDFERNMSDEMIKALKENGGVIQINFGSTFIDEKSRTYDGKAHEYKLKFMEEQNLQEGDSLLKAEMKKYRQENFFSTVQKVADHIDHVVKIAGVDYVGLGSDFDGVGDSLPIGLKDVSDYPNLIFELLKRGYSDEDIEKICYKNVFRVWNEVIATAEKLQKEA